MRFRYSYGKKAFPISNSGDPDQLPHSVMSDLALHCLQTTLLGVSRLQWVKMLSKILQMTFYFFVTNFFLRGN